LNESKELYRQGKKEDETASHSQMVLAERSGSSRLPTPRILEAQKEGIPHQYSSGSSLKRNTFSLLKQNETRSNIRNQSAITSTTKIIPTNSNANSFKLTPNMIANIFEDFFTNTNDLFD
jgi:hypothetical protein